MGVLIIFKKDVNLTLLLLIVVLILIYSIFSVHYNQTLSNVTKYYSNNSVKSTTGNVVLQQNSPNSLLQKDKEELERRYFESNNENTNLTEENIELKSQLRNLQEQFNKLNNRFSEVQEALQKANDGISRLIARNNELCRELKEAGGKDEKCK